MLSFIVPAHNEQGLLPETLRGVFTSAASVGCPFEVIVVDDASTDQTAQIARDAGAKVVSVHLRQIAAVRNAGARAAGGDVFFFVDADTLISPATLRQALEALEQGAIGGGARIRLDEQCPLWGRLGTWLFTVVYFGLGLAAGCFLFTRRKPFEAVGGFDEAYYASEEVHLSRALRREGRFVIVAQPVLTSGRKFRTFSAWGILKLPLRFLVQGFAVVKKREGLDLWYDAPREDAPPRGK